MIARHGIAYPQHCEAYAGHGIAYPRDCEAYAGHGNACAGDGKMIAGACSIIKTDFPKLTFQRKKHTKHWNLNIWN